jgi:hypothetical protein
MSLTQLITSWAPPTQNATDVYLANVAARVEIVDLHDPLWNLLELGKPGL